MKDIIFSHIKGEEERQITGVELIASENYVSSNVLSAMGSILTNKYSEGYSGRRYYKGNEFIDHIEELAIQRAKEVFGAEHVNVQPYSGSPANLAVYYALLQPGDTIMGMKLDAGGHLTHGYRISFSGTWFKNVNYGVDDNGFIDISEVRDLAKQYKPKLIWVGGSAYSRKLDFSAFREIADEVGAYLVADIAHIAGLVAAGVHENPTPIVDIVTTTTHKTLRGPRGAMIMCKKEFAERIDKAVFPGLQGGPHNHTTAAIAVALGEAMTPGFKQYAEQVVINAQALSAQLIKHGFKVITGGTDNHMFLVDTTAKGADLHGEYVSSILESVNITLNKNAIPNDPRKPWDPSGIRIGTPAITTRGLLESNMEDIANFIADAIESRGDNERIAQIKADVALYMSEFPLFNKD